MAVIATTKLGNGSSVSQSSYATASIAPVANRVYLLSVASYLSSGTPNIPTLSGAGMTWTQVTTKLDGNANHRRLTVFRALSASPGSGAVTIDFGGQAQTTATWILDELQGMDKSGTNGERAVVQTANNVGSGATTGLSVALSGFGSSQNATYGVVMGPFVIINHGVNFTELQQTSEGVFIEFESQFAASNQTSIPWTWASTTADIVAIAIEIRSKDQFQGAMI